MARRRGRIVRAAPRTKMWIGAGLTNTAVVASGTVLLQTLNALALLQRPFTILRTRIELLVQSDQLSSSEFSQGVYTHQVVTDSATAAGAASIPSGITQPEADYYVYQGCLNSFLLATAVGFLENTGGGNAYTIDSKAMRKVGIDDDIAVMFENRAAVGMQVASEGRILIQLH